MIVTTPEPPITAWSFNRLITYEKCGYWAFLEYGEKRPKPETHGREAADRGVQIHEDAENYIKGAGQVTPLIEKWVDRLEPYRERYALGYVSCEGDWGFNLDWAPVDWMAKDVWARIKLDVMDRTSEITADIIDWKSGKKENNEVKHLQQGQVYAIGTMMKFPELKEVTVSFEYIDHKNQRLRRTYSRDYVMRFMPNFHKRALALTTATQFVAKPNKINCRFCPYGPNNGGDNSCPVGVEIDNTAPVRAPARNS